jgi:hypothetical protein
VSARSHWDQTPKTRTEYLNRGYFDRVIYWHRFAYGAPQQHNNNILEQSLVGHQQQRFIKQDAIYSATASSFRENRICMPGHENAVDRTRENKLDESAVGYSAGKLLKAI